MGKGMSKVVDNLYVGSFADSNDKETLDRSKISHIVTAMESGGKTFEDKVYLVIEISDTYGANIAQHFPNVIEFIHEQRLNNSGVLVHCMAGASRSVTLVVAYLATVTGVPWRECLNAVRSARRQANPNLGFQQQLDMFERQDIVDVRNDLFKKFTNYHFADEDEKAIRSLVTNFELESANPRYANPFYDTLSPALSVAHLGISPADTAANGADAIQNVMVSPGGTAVGFTIPGNRSGKRHPPKQIGTAKSFTENSVSDGKTSTAEQKNQSTLPVAESSSS